MQQICTTHAARDQVAGIPISQADIIPVIRLLDTAKATSEGWVNMWLEVQSQIGKRDQSHVWPAEIGILPKQAPLILTSKYLLARGCSLRN